MPDSVVEALAVPCSSSCVDIVEVKWVTYVSVVDPQAPSVVLRL